MIYANLKGVKELKSYPNAGHNVFSDENRKQWIEDVTAFMTTLHHQP